MEPSEAPGGGATGGIVGRGVDRDPPLGQIDGLRLLRQKRRGQGQTRQLKPVARKVFVAIVTPEYPPGPQAGAKQDDDGNNDDKNNHFSLFCGWSFRMSVV